jgi:hypothetical protein
LELVHALKKLTSVYKVTSSTFTCIKFLLASRRPTNRTPPFFGIAERSKHNDQVVLEESMVAYGKAIQLQRVEQIADRFKLAPGTKKSLEQSLISGADQTFLCVGEVPT